MEVGVSTDAGLVWHPELQLDAAAALLEPEKVKCSGGRGGPALTVTPGGWHQLLAKCQPHPSSEQRKPKVPASVLQEHHAVESSPGRAQKMDEIWNHWGL